jgi:alkaline phosphatase D
MGRIHSSARRRSLLRTFGGFVLVAGGSTAAAGADDRVPLTHGVAAAETTANSTVLWARTEGEATLRAVYAPDGDYARARRASTDVDRSTDFTGRLPVSGLRPDTRYEYCMWAASPGGGHGRPSDPTTGEFRTAPAPGADAPVTFAWSGDTFGQGVVPPYPVLAAVDDLDPDFFFNFGDTIYADSTSPAVPTAAETLEEFRAKHREVRERSENLRELLRTTPVYAIWDDHEVTNNWSGDEPLMPLGRQAFMEYWPTVSFRDDPNRLHRSFRWGRHVELFICDNRQYRDPNSKPDGPTKTMLGDEQRAWLKRRLAESSATFKLVGGTTPLCIPIGDPRDAWASGGSETGFEHELLDIIEFTQTESVENVVWLNTDRHYAQVTEYDVDRDGTTDFHSAFVGPIGAATLDPTIDDLDPTLNPTPLYREGGFFNFGVVRVDPAGPTLTLEVRDETGTVRFATDIEATE